MILYHGSCVEVSAPDVVHFRSNVDFGKGFYATPIYDQARKWAAMNANPTLLQKKYARIVNRYADRYQVTLETALERFYHSELYQLVSSGVADLHCMSDEYLVEELHDEWSQKPDSQ